MSLLSILSLSLICEMGIVTDHSMYNYYQETYFAEKGNTDFYYILFDVELTAWDILYIKGRMNNVFMQYKDEISFVPLNDYYSYEMGLKLSPFEIGFKHYCFHPINVYRSMLPYTETVFEYLEGGANSFFVRAELTFN